jgi:hypothetical protein
MLVLMVVVGLLVLLLVVLMVLLLLFDVAVRFFGDMRGLNLSRPKDFRTVPSYHVCCHIPSSEHSIPSQKNNYSTQNRMPRA